MTDLILTISGIIVFFILFLILKELLPKMIKKKFCVICASVFTTWVILLILFWLGIFTNKTIIALLIGQSILGIFYLAEKKADEKLKLFRLPFLLTLIFSAYLLLEKSDFILTIISMLLILWAFFLLLYFYKSRRNDNEKKDNKQSLINSFIKKIIECCKNW